MNKNKWKALAIIFIILFILETSMFIWLLNLGTQSYEKENECSINICGFRQADGYYYNPAEEICTCYIDNEIIYEKYMD